MCATWSALHDSLVRDINRRAAESDFTRLREQYSELERFASIPALIEHQRDLGVDPARRYVVVRRLVEAAQSDDSSAGTALRLGFLTLWPGLEGVHYRLARGFPAVQADMGSEVLSQATLSILTLDLTRVEKVAATVVRNTERDIMRRLAGAASRERRERDIADPLIESRLAELAREPTTRGSAVEDLLRCLHPLDQALVIRIVTLDETQQEAGRALGLSPAAARKRHQRALIRLREIIR